MSLRRPFRFFAPTLAVALAAAAGAIACGSVVDVAAVAPPSDGGVAMDGATKGPVSAASWELQFLPWDAAQRFSFAMFDQTVVAASLSTASSPSYVLNLSTRGGTLARTTLYDGAPIRGTFVGGSPKGAYVAFHDDNATTLYEVGPAGTTARATVSDADVPVGPEFRVGDDGSWATLDGTRALFGGPAGAATLEGSGLSSLSVFAKERATFGRDSSDIGFLVTAKGRFPLGPVYESTYIADRLLLRAKGATATDVWSLGDVPARLGSIVLPESHLRGSNLFFHPDGSGFRLVASAEPPGVTMLPFPAVSTAMGPTDTLVGVTDDNQRVVARDAAQKGARILAVPSRSMVLAPLVPGGAVAFSDGNPVASGSAGFVAWTPDGARALLPVGFAVKGAAPAFRQVLTPARGAFAMRTIWFGSISGGDVIAEFAAASGTFAKQAEGQTGLFDRNASAPRWLPRTGLPPAATGFGASLDRAVADRGFSVVRASSGMDCLYQFGANDRWTDTGRCLEDPIGGGGFDNAGDAFAVATETEVLVSLPGQPTLRAPSPALTNIAFDGKRVLGFDAASTVYVFEIQGDRLVKVFERLVPGVQSVALDGNSDRGMLGLEDGAALLVAK